MMSVLIGERRQVTDLNYLDHDPNSSKISFVCPIFFLYKNYIFYVVLSEL